MRCLGGGLPGGHRSHFRQAGHDLRHLLNRAERRAVGHANISVVTIVVRRSSGANSAAMLGRFSVPAGLLRVPGGDSGRNGRMMISGMAGMTPDISVYRHGACGSAHGAEPVDCRQACGVADGQTVAVATSSPPIEENACV